MQTKHFIIATAGHVDHGKSSVVKALTGVDPDRLPEEKARGITIDLGFAHLDLPHSAQKDVLFRVGIVDVPGHEDFVKNMVAGVGAINLALLIVAADDGWMPQTEEHLQIVEYLGVGNAIVALTKIDLAEGPEDNLLDEVRSHLEKSSFQNAPIIPFSAASGRGLTELKNALAAELEKIEPPPDCGKPRLSADRVFSLKGIGTVVTGTLTGGILRKGDSVVIQPRGASTRVRNIQSHKEDVEIAWPGTRTALNIPDAASVGESRGVQRGDVITIPALGASTDVIDVLVSKSPRSAAQPKGAGRPLKDGMIVRWHQGSANFRANLLLREEKEIAPGKQGIAQLRFDQPVFVLAGERFILRDWSERYTIGGGIVLDVDQGKVKFRDGSQTNFLKARAVNPDSAEAAVAAIMARDKMRLADDLLRNTVFSAGQIRQAVAALAAAKKCVTVGTFVTEAAWWNTELQRAKEAITKYHKAHPEQQGMPINELRAQLNSLPSLPGAFDACLAALAQEGFLQSGTVIRARQHAQALPPHLQAAGTRVRSSLKAKPLDPPSRKELAPDASSQQALRFLVETKEVVELSPEIVMLRSAYEQAREIVVREIKSKGRAGASELRQALNSSRRVVIPLLEKFDKEGITRREGDHRVLSKNSL